MTQTFRSIRPFIGSKDYSVSRKFYAHLGFKESVIAPNMSYFDLEGFGFYLQDAYVKDWVDNTMLFMEVADVNSCWNNLVSLGLQETYEGVRLIPVKRLEWGSECFLHDPSGILWHFGQFNV